MSYVFDDLDRSTGQARHALNIRREYHKPSKYRAKPGMSLRILCREGGAHGAWALGPCRYILHMVRTVQASGSISADQICAQKVRSTQPSTPVQLEALGLAGSYHTPTSPSGGGLLIRTWVRGSREERSMARSRGTFTSRANEASRRRRAKGEGGKMRGTGQTDRLCLGSISSTSVSSGCPLLA